MEKGVKMVKLCKNGVKMVYNCSKIGIKKYLVQK